MSIVESTVTPPSQVWDEFTPSVDQRLPLWARRSNPIVKRHLGVHWKVLPLEMDLLIRILGVQVALIMLSILVPIILPLLFTLLPVSLVMAPIVLFGYMRLLVQVGNFTVLMMVDEKHNNTLSLLRTTPLPLRHILYSKASAGVWRQIEDLGLIIMGVAILTLPLVGLQYAAYWSFEDVTLFSRLALIIGMLSSVVRLILEPVMIASLAVLIGASVPVRAPALLSVIALGFFYFLLINLPRLLPLSLELRVFIEYVLPVLLPIAITLGAFRLAEHVIRRD